MEEPVPVLKDAEKSTNVEPEEKIELQNEAEELSILSQLNLPESPAKDPAAAILELIMQLPADKQEEIKTRLSTSETSNQSVDNEGNELEAEEKPAELDLNSLCNSTFAAIAAISRNEEPADVEMEDLTGILPSTSKKLVEIAESMDVDLSLDIEPESEITFVPEIVNKKEKAKESPSIPEVIEPESDVVLKESSESSNTPTEILESTSLTEVLESTTIAKETLESSTPNETLNTPEITIIPIDITLIEDKNDEMEVDGKVDAPTAAGEDDDDIIFIEDEETNPLDGPVGGPATPLELPDVSFFLINKGTNIDIVHGLAMINPEAMTPIKKKVTLKVKSDDPPSLQALSLNPEIEIRPGPKFTKKKVTLIIDSVAKKTCINTSCPKKSESFCDATSMMLDIYYVNKSKKKQSICEDCFDKAYEQINDFARQFIEGKPIITVKRPEKPDLVEIIDSDEEGDAATSGDEKSDEYEPIKNITALLNLNFAAMLEDFNEKFDIQKQYDLSVAHFNKSLDENEAKIADINNKFNKIETDSNRMYNALYNVNKFKITHMPPLDLYHGLESNDQVHPIEANPHPEPPKQTSTKRTVVQKPLPRQILEKKVQGQQFPLERPVYPQYTHMPSAYYAMRNKFPDSWAPCRLLEKISIAGTIAYKVQFSAQKINTISTMKTVSGKELAYGSVSEKLEVGTRVLAEFVREGTLTTGIRDKVAGVIGEKLNKYNSRRYLVFGDDGRVQYIPYQHVHSIVEVSQHVWNDVHSSARKSIREFMEQHERFVHTKQRNLLNVRKNHRIVTEKNGQWKNATILDTDASLVKLQFVDDGTVEWIYLASMRLGPVYQNSLPAKTAGSIAKRRNDNSMQMITIDDDEDGPAVTIEPPAKRSVAKKSTSKAQPSETLPPHASRDQMPPQQPGQAKIKILNDDNIYVDDPARVARIRHFTPRTGISAQKYGRHICNPDCAPKNMLNLAMYPPLAKPLLLSWERQVNKQKSFKSIMYKAPCGRRLRNINEVHKYLITTKFFRLNVDNFDFDMTIQVLANYEVEKSLCGLFVEDFSKGKEAMKIQVVNAFDDSAPNLQRYENARTPTEGVNINTDREFLCSCDCKDDCLDKTKCACFLMTLEGAKYKNIMEQAPSEIGYVFKRLLHHVPTGIYECNKGCQCNSRCLNKVVQQPIQVKLQIYRTKNRGWGLQCLHDVAKGTFICIYAGLLYTERTANALCALPGVEHGDEYFAELDYIESTQNLKDGYESDAGAIHEDGDNSEENDDSDSDYDEGSVGPHARKSASGREIVTRSGKRPAAQASKSNQMESSMDLDAGNGDNSDSDEEAKEDAAPNAMSAPPRPTEFKRFRKYFGPKERVYIMDAKTTGNVGRYFNHSCSPNLFVQSVFVDTQDVRFPWIAFFAQKAIKAGEELTWNYNYEVNSVPNKVLYCKCGSKNCRNRIL